MADAIHDNNNIFDKISKASSSITFQLNGYTYIGSGSFVTLNNDDLSEGLFMTAAHCVMTIISNSVVKVAKFYLTNPITKKWTSISPSDIYYDGIADVALMKTGIDFSGETDKDIPLRLATTEVSTGDKCFLIGNPAGWDSNSFTEGEIRDAKAYESSGAQVPESLFISATGYGGNSGSPIVNLIGEIIGIYTFSYNNANNVGGGSNLTVLNKVLPQLYNLFNSGAQDSNAASKNYLGISYYTPASFAISGAINFYDNVNEFENMGVWVYAHDNTYSPFRSLFGDGTSEIHLLSYKKKGDTDFIPFGVLPNQCPPGVLCYLPTNTEIDIKYISKNGDKTSWSATITLNQTYTGLESADSPLGGGMYNPQMSSDVSFPLKLI
jgi:S1-C subfamily serine protease